MNNKGKYWDKPWNPVIGCTKCSPGCLNCWAENLHAMRFRARNWAKANLPEQYAKPFDEIQLLEHRLDMPLHWRKPRTTFVCNMSDLFHEEVPFEFVDKIYETMLHCPQHKFLVLTKRPERMLEYYRTKTHVVQEADTIHLGTTICNQAEADAKIPVLLQIPAAKRWLSIEPMLGPVDLTGIGWERSPTNKAYLNVLTGKAAVPFTLVDCGKVDWVVLGCESGPNRRPCKIEWMIDIVKQCQAAGVSIFVKQIPSGVAPMTTNKETVLKNMEHPAWPEKLRVRDAI